MKNLRNKKGIASIEAVAMMIVFVILMAYGVGVFGVIHTGILNSIAARTYAWETFNHRTNLNLFRDRVANDSETDEYFDFEYRIHSICSERDEKCERWVATERVIAMGRETEDLTTRNTASHKRLQNLTKRERFGVNPVWIKTLYGICLSSACGTVDL